MNMTVRKAEAVQAVSAKHAAEVVRLKAPKSGTAATRLLSIAFLDIGAGDPAAGHAGACC